MDILSPSYIYYHDTPRKMEIRDFIQRCEEEHENGKHKTRVVATNSILLIIRSAMPLEFRSLGMDVETAMTASHHVFSLALESLCGCSWYDMEKRLECLPNGVLAYLSIPALKLLKTITFDLLQFVREDLEFDQDVHQYLLLLENTAKIYGDTARESLNHNPFRSMSVAKKVYYTGENNEE